MSETAEHKGIKDIISRKLKEWYGAAITEHAVDGHKADVFAVTKEGKRILVEVIWTPSGANFDRDINIIHESEAEIKIVIVNPAILAQPKLNRKFEIVRIAQQRHGSTISELIDGSLILRNSRFVDTEFKSIVDQLLKTSGGLQIVFDPASPELLGEYKYESSELIRKVARTEIWNHSSEKARTVNGILTVLEGPKRPRPCKLHFAFTPETTSEPEPVDIDRGSYKIVDVVFSQPDKIAGSTEEPQGSINVVGTSGGSFLGTWGSMVETELRVGTQSPVLTRSQQIPPSLEIRPFDVHEEGCYIASNDALRWPKAYSQHHLPPGDYIIEVSINSENLASISKKFRLASPKRPSDLVMENL